MYFETTTTGSLYSVHEEKIHTLSFKWQAKQGGAWYLIWVIIQGDGWIYGGGWAGV